MIFGIDIGGSYIDIVKKIGDEFFHISSIPTNQEAINNIIEEYSNRRVGIAIAGWIRKGEIVNAPNLPFKIDKIKANVIENDANCFAFGISKLYNQKNMLGITVGTGIGMGIIIDGKIFKGEGVAGELGHTIVSNKGKCVCGGVGHLECYFSGWSIKKRYGKDAKELFEENKFPYDKNFNIFCRAVANAILLFDLPFVAIGGRIGGRIREDKIRNRIYEYLPKQFKPEIKVIKDDLMVAKGVCLLVEESEGNIIK